jgi:metallo-beta-lactamase family protein
LGRRILEGEKLVKIHGEQVAVNAAIRNIDAYSAHADRSGLIKWVKGFKTLPGTIFLVHGEEKAQMSLADALTNECHAVVQIPEWQSEYELMAQTETETVKNKTQQTPFGLEKALQAEKLYLELRMKLHNQFMQQWNNKEYDQIISNLSQLEEKFKEA